MSVCVSGQTFYLHYTGIVKMKLISKNNIIGSSGFCVPSFFKNVDMIIFFQAYFSGRRRFKSTPIGRKAVFIMLVVQRVLCLACGALSQVKIGFADERRSYAKGFERYAPELSRHMTIKDVAAHMGVSWDVIKDIRKRNLNRRFAKPKLRKLKRIAIDEISIGKGRRYLTIVLDLSTGAVVKEDLRRLWGWTDKKAAEWHLKSWIAMARASKISMLTKFANTLSAHRTGILAYFDHRISTGTLEGTNNKIKTMKRQAYGYRDMEFLKLKIPGLHEIRYALVG